MFKASLAEDVLAEELNFTLDPDFISFSIVDSVTTSG